MSNIQKFSLVRTTQGVLSIKNNLNGEIMHNPVGPWQEAHTLYIQQSQLKELLQKNEKLTLFDVGLGAATNAIAALHTWSQLEKPKAQLEIISFEIDLSLLEFVLAHASDFDYYSPYLHSLKNILEKKIDEGSQYSWKLIHGDFAQIPLANQCDLIFFDPYSPKENPEMWTLSLFEKLYEASSQQCCFYTYSRATKVRSALLAAGFYVGHGLATGLKEETTVASRRLDLLAQPLGQRWLERFLRSHDACPYGLSEDQFPSLKEKIIHHPQFSSFQ